MKQLILIAVIFLSGFSCERVDLPKNLMDEKVSEIIKP